MAVDMDKLQEFLGMGDPLAAARHIRQALKPDGTWLVVEPYALDEVSGAVQPRLRGAPVGSRNTGNWLPGHHHARELSPSRRAHLSHRLLHRALPVPLP